MAAIFVSLSKTSIWRTKQENLSHCTIPTPVDLILQQISLKVFLRVLSTALNTSICINLLIFVTNGIMITVNLKNSNFYYNSQTKLCFQPKLSENTKQQSCKTLNNESFATSIS